MLCLKTLYLLPEGRRLKSLWPCHMDPLCPVEVRGGWWFLVLICWPPTGLSCPLQYSQHTTLQCHMSLHSLLVIVETSNQVCPQVTLPRHFQELLSLLSFANHYCVGVASSVTLNAIKRERGNSLKWTLFNCSGACCSPLPLVHHHFLGFGGFSKTFFRDPPLQWQTWRLCLGDTGKGFSM